MLTFPSRIRNPNLNELHQQKSMILGREETNRGWSIETMGLRSLENSPNQTTCQVPSSFRTRGWSEIDFVNAKKRGADLETGAALHCHKDLLQSIGAVDRS